MLGDGRAMLLGEHVTPTGERFDITLKGSGPTAYARRGDGLATLGSNAAGVRDERGAARTGPAHHAQLGGRNHRSRRAPH